MAGPWHSRTERGCSRAKLSRIARPAGWAGMALGARHRTTRSNTSADISSPRTPPSCPWSTLTAGPSNRISTSTTKLSRCSPMRAGTASLARPAAGADKQWRCAGRSRNAMPIHSAAFSRIAAADCRSARTRTCTCSKSALAWIPLDDDPAWRSMGDAIATLCLEKFIDPATGALREFFAADWSPAPGVDGRICEPGHHYEWAFLLDRWARLTGRPLPEAVARLIAFADSCGVDPHRGVVINAVLTDGSIARSRGAAVGASRTRARLPRPPARRRRDRRGRHGAAALSRDTDSGLMVRSVDHPPMPSCANQRARPVSITSSARLRSCPTRLLHPENVGVRANGSDRSAARVIYLVTEDWYFISHRLPMARAARDAGFDVHVATRVDRHGPPLKRKDFTFIPSPGAAAALTRAIWSASYARCASSIAPSSRPSPITLRCRQPSLDRSRPPAFPSFASMR